MGRELPAHQTWFTKPGTAVNGPYDPVQRPKVSEQLDYEVELVVVIGKRCRHVPAEKAQEVIFGYCVGNDVSVRDWQTRTQQFVIGKSFDTHAPFGPRSEEHTSELQSLMRISYAVFCLKKKNKHICGQSTDITKITD